MDIQNIRFSEMIANNKAPIATEFDCWWLRPMSEKRVYIPLDLVFSKAEFDKIRQGLIPREMEDKWFVYTKEGHIYFHRSWTGNMIFDCLFEKREEDVHIIGFYATRDINVYTNDDPEWDIFEMRGILSWMLHQ